MIKKRLHCLCVYYITWLVKTQFCRDSHFEACHSDIGSKRTNHKFGCSGEVRQSNILIPSKIPFIRKCVFLNLIQFLFQKGGRGDLPPHSPFPCAGPDGRCSVLGSFGVILMSCKVDFNVVRSALQNSVCLLSVYFCCSGLLSILHFAAYSFAVL